MSPLFDRFGFSLKADVAEADFSDGFSIQLWSLRDQFVTVLLPRDLQEDPRRYDAVETLFDFNGLRAQYLPTNELSFRADGAAPIVISLKGEFASV